MGTAPEAPTLELPPVPRWERGRPRLAAHRTHPRRLAAGHRQLLARTAAWPLAERISGAAFGGLMAWRVAHGQTRLLAITAGAYAIVAWRAGRPVPPVPPTEEDLQRQFLLGVRRPPRHPRSPSSTRSSRPGLPPRTSTTPDSARSSSAAACPSSRSASAPRAAASASRPPASQPSSPSVLQRPLPRV
ncbi:hypothetical protein [Streptomyces sp. NPDC056632]|uniref:hypothetical protein n=1 Tax=Streptomyces sp. NPDC056632 TaxID=3345884 RepID=UPI0036B4E931